MTELEKFTMSEARPLPVILLADVSGSMDQEGKISALNQSVKEMLSTFATSDDLRAEIHVAIITFGGRAELHTPLQTAAQIQWQAMTAGGGTPMNDALMLAADLVEDRERIPGRAYRPTVILLSDGQPDAFPKEGLARFNGQGRAAKVDRMALAIGGDADVAMMKRFLGGDDKEVLFAADARRIKDLFKFVTMSVTARSRSANPNEVLQMDDPFAIDRL